VGCFCVLGFVVVGCEFFVTMVGFFFGLAVCFVGGSLSFRRFRGVLGPGVSVFVGVGFFCSPLGFSPVSFGCFSSSWRSVCGSSLYSRCFFLFRLWGVFFFVFWGFFGLCQDVFDIPPLSLCVRVFLNFLPPSSFQIRCT